MKNAFYKETLHRLYRYALPNDIIITPRLSFVVIIPLFELISGIFLIFKCFVTGSILVFSRASVATYMQNKMICNHKVRQVFP